MIAALLILGLKYGKQVHQNNFQVKSQLKIDPCRQWLFHDKSRGTLDRKAGHP